MIRLFLSLLVLRVAIIYLLNLFVELSTEEGHRIKCTYSRAQVCFDTPRIFLSLYKVLLVSGAEGRKFVYLLYIENQLLGICSTFWKTKCITQMLRPFRLWPRTELDQ